MSIETPGLIEADNFQGTAAQAGFVKNDASGNFMLGETGSAWTLIENFVVPSDTTDFTFAATLNGDVDFQYRIVYTAFQPVFFAGLRLFLRPNAITTGGETITRRYGMNGNAGFLMPGLVLAQVNAHTLEAQLYGDFDFTAHTGQQRLLVGQQSENKISASGPVFSRTNGYLHYGKWADTTTNITSLKVETDGLAWLPAGSEWALYKVKRV